MRIVVFGLTISSSWGNAHATLWRGLARALGRLGHHVTFFERDMPYYAVHRDLHAFEGGELRLYGTFAEARSAAEEAVAAADAAMVTSFCPDGEAACELVGEARGAVRAYYDLDTPVTLEHVRAGRRVPYLGPAGLTRFDVVLSVTGGAALVGLRDALGARRVFPLYGSVDPEVHRQVPSPAVQRADLSYLGTWAADREDALRELFLDVAVTLPERRFVLGGSLYPSDFPWPPNVRWIHHVPPADHAAFYASSALTLNVTRGAMARMGYCPSGRLFEAAAAGVPILSDTWEGLDRFFTPGREILVARSTAEAVDALSQPEGELARIGRAGRERALADHTADRRARELVSVLGSTARGGDR